MRITDPPLSPKDVNLSLLASAERSATGQGTIVQGMVPFARATLQIDVTAVTGITPTLDVALQRLMPDGSTWDTIARFEQMTAADKRVLDLWASASAGERAVDDSTSAPTLAAGTVQRWTRDSHVGSPLA